MRYIRQASIVTVFLVSLALTAKAQETLTPLGSKTVESPDLLDVPELTLEQIREQEQQAEAVLQLRDIQTSLDVKRIARKGLRRKLGDANSSAKEDIQFELDEIDSEIELLEMTFEQIAIGGIDLSVFGIKEKSFDWREELVLIVKPLIENVKSLTEKPRKIESLRRFISNKVAAKQASRDALESIERIKKEAVSNSVLQNLSNIESDWLSRLDDLDREIQLAEYQLDSLEGKNVPWFQIFKQGSLDFISGRGLTILLLFLAAGIVWAFMRSILWLIRKRTRDSSDRSSKTHYRLAAYGYRLLTAILIAMAIMMVLYFRQDLLLLAVMVVIFIGAALALKNLLPTYITESRLLLNMGSVREKERVIYNGLPWEVSNINMYSLLTNPKIRGGVRLPISHMHEMISRPSVGDTWFPSSEGDWILDAAGDPVKVIRQSVDVIELEDLDSVKRVKLG